MFIAARFALAFAIFSAPGLGHAETVVLHLAHAGSPSSSQHIAVLKMAELVSEKTRGTVRIQIHPNSELGNDAKTIVDMQRGTVDMVLAGSNAYVKLAPRLVEIDLPFSFQTSKEAWHELDSKYYGQLMLNETSQGGVKGLAFFDLGFRLVSSNRGFIKTPEDLKGLKLRVGTLPTKAFFDTLGVQTVSMPLGEIYAAIKEGKLDGQDIPLPASYAAKLYEVQKYLTMTRHAYTALLVSINKARFDALSPSQQQALSEAAVSARDFQRAMNTQNEATMIADLRSKGVQVLDHIESGPFKVLAMKQNSSYFAQRMATTTGTK